MSLLLTHLVGALPTGGEFQGRNGDCAEYAFMVARRANDGVSPTTGAELNRLTSESISAGQAGAAGQMTDANLVWLCGREGVAYLQVGFSAALLRRYAGRCAMTCGFANGQALPGNEQNVFGHCVAVVGAGVDQYGGDVYILANGDSANGRAGQTDRCPFSQLLMAQPTTLTILIGGCMLNIEDTNGAFVATDATHWQARNGHVVELGMLAKYRTDNGLERLGLPLEDEQFNLGAGISHQAFECGVLYYSAGTVSYGKCTDNRLNGPFGLAPVHDNAPLVANLTADLSAALATVKQIQ